ncbi:hypothetical protein IQA79_07265 [Leptospira borgpetersenii serovar Ballum]|uniref:hypothetical protein n=1 Tax=Leptospira borgpetersenii TaxID=174 RepID=UPI00187E05E2|nr:hypothetical protein [Leptospira borgpetersenii]MBE8244699.1 hypothetical protein [Leptospira borgpetersenii serovar Ballum]
MIKDDNSHGEGRDLGMDELQFDDIDSMLASESSSEPNGLEGPSIDSDPLESLVASSGEEYPSSFENDFYFHPEETGSNPSLEDIELTDPVVDVEIEKLLDVDDFVDSSTSNISNLESDDSFFNPGDSAPDEGMDFSELDNYLTDESDAIDFGEESDDIEELDLSDQDKEKNISSHEDDFLNEEGPIALSESELEEIVSVDEPLPDFISPSPEEENITLSNLDGILGEEELPETDTILETTFDESEEDGSIAFSGSELDDILNTTADESTAVTNAVADDDLPDFITHTDLDENEEGIASSLDFEPETTSFESESDEAIALSDEELGNLLASENEEGIASSLDFEPETTSFESEPEEGIDSSLDFEPETTSFESEPDEAIALSDEELGNLLASENEEAIASSLDFEPETTSFESEPEEAIALSDEELGNLLASENEEGIASSLDFEPETTSFESESEETIALSEDELGNLLASENEEGIASSLDFEPETTSFESESDEAIALSDEELGNLLASENEEGIASSLDFEPETTSFESESEEAIALSEDELGNLLASENEEGIASSLDFEPETTSFESESEEAIALSEDELGNLLASENEEGIASSLDFEPETTSFESEPEEAIALSDEELGNLLASENEEGIASSLDFEPETTSLQGDDSISLPAHELDSIGDIPSSQEDLENFELSTDDSKQTQTSEATFFETEDSEPIALSLDELDHILTDNDDSNVSENTLDEFPTSGADWDDSPVSEQTPTAPLSEEEPLEDTPTTVKEEDLNEILGELPPTSDLDAFDSIDDNVSKEKAASQVVPTEGVVNEDEMVIVLDEYAEEEKSSPIEELRKTPDQSEIPKEDASRETPSKEEMKRIMTYLDELLGNLPDDLIREFSRSDYFELYKKLMKQIGV